MIQWHSMCVCVLHQNVEGNSRTIGQNSSDGWGGRLGDRPGLWGTRFHLCCSAHFILFFSPINLFFFFYSSRMMCQRRSSAGEPRRWQAQDIRNTSSEQQIGQNRMQSGCFQNGFSFVSLPGPVSTSCVRRCPQNTPAWRSRKWTPCREPRTDMEEGLDFRRTAWTRLDIEKKKTTTFENYSSVRTSTFYSLVWAAIYSHSHVQFIYWILQKNNKKSVTGVNKFLSSHPKGWVAMTINISESLSTWHKITVKGNPQICSWEQFPFKIIK